jgi:hypothetical protein
MPRGIQGLLPIADPADLDLVEEEVEAMRRCPELRPLTAGAARLVMAYLRSRPDDTMDAVATRAKISRSAAYQYLRDPDVQRAIAAVAQTTSSIEDARLSIAHDLLAEGLVRDIIAGKVWHGTLTAQQWQILVAAKQRLGLVPGRSLGVRVTGPDGRSTDVWLQDGAGDILDEHLAALQEQCRGTAPGGFELKKVDFVQGDPSSEQAQPGAAGQLGPGPGSETGREGAADPGDPRRGNIEGGLEADEGDV